MPGRRGRRRRPQPDRCGRRACQSPSVDVYGIGTQSPRQQQLIETMGRERGCTAPAARQSPAPIHGPCHPAGPERRRSECTVGPAATEPLLGPPAEARGRPTDSTDDSRAEYAVSCHGCHGHGVILLRAGVILLRAAGPVAESLQLAFAASNSKGFLLGRDHDSPARANSITSHQVKFKPESRVNPALHIWNLGSLLYSTFFLLYTTLAI